MSEAFIAIDGNVTADREVRAPAPPSPLRATARVELLLVTFLLLLFPALLLGLFVSWPTDSDGPGSMRWFGLVTCAGALGAYVHVARSVGAYIGNNALLSRWVYWYLLRLPVGATLALLVSFLMQSDVVLEAGQHQNGSLFRMVGLSALAGLFSDGTIKKLTDWFDMIFRARDATLKDSLSESMNARPVLQRLEPAVLAPRGGEVRLIGENFQESSRVLVNGRVHKPDTTRDKTLSIRLASAELEGQSSITMQVMTPDSQDASVCRLSDALSLEVPRDSSDRESETRD